MSSFTFYLAPPPPQYYDKCIVWVVYLSSSLAYALSGDQFDNDCT